MAAVQSATRQPFGSIEGSRLRNLSNVKNRQNALHVTLSSPVKRPYSPSFDDVNSENIDPLILNSPSKRAKNFDGYPVKASPISHFVLKDSQASVSSFSRPIITPKRLVTARSPTRKQAAPSSAPAAAGRSPKSKRVGILSRRRVSSSPFTRVDPPSFSLSNGLPFSIDAALSGTVSSYKPEPVQPTPVSTLDDSVPESWMFNIHEDTPDSEADNLMHFRAQTLDISDDESRAAKDDRGKENIPPNDFPSLSTAQAFTTTRPVSRKDMMTDEPRTPLADLDATEFYAEGCDASSYIIVPAEKSCSSNEKPYDVLAAKDLAAPVLAQPTAVDESQNGWKDLLAMVEEKKKSHAAATLAAATEAKEEVAPIEIWESESAKGEDDAAVQEMMVAPLEEGSSASGVAGAVEEMALTF